MLIYVLVSRKRIIKWENATGWAKLTQANSKKHDKRNNVIAKILLSIVAVVFTLVMIPEYKDIPYTLTGNYLEIRGTVTQDQKGESGRKSSWLWLTAVFIEDVNTGEVERLRIREKSLKKGDHVYVRYLPHSKQGSLIDCYIDLN